jgi:general secretion pathway protein D
MTTSINKSLKTILIIFAAMIMGCLSSAEWALRAQGRSPTSEGEKKQALESLMKQVQQNQKSTAPLLQAQASPAPPLPQGGSPLPAGPIPAAPQPSGAGQRVQFNVESLDLNEFINEVATQLGISPIIVDPEVKGTVTIVSPSSMNKDDLFPLFNLILKNNNAAFIKWRGIYQIVPIQAALKKGVEIIEQLPEPSTPKPASEQTPAKTEEPKFSGNPLNELKAMAAAEAAKRMPAGVAAVGSSGAPHLVTNIIRVEFVPVSDLIDPIKLFMTDGGVIMPYPRLNMLILTDYTDSAARVLQIIRMLDTNFLDPDLIELVKINNNASSDIVEDLKKIFGSGKDTSTGISFISMDRLNAIFLIASSKRALGEAKSWIEKLDAASARNIQTYFYMVQNSTASNIAMMLSALYGDSDSSSNQAGQATNATAGSGGLMGTTAGGGRNQAGGRMQQGASGTMGQSTFGGQFGSQGGGGINQGMSTVGGGLGTGSGMGQQLGPQLNVQPTISSQVLRGGAFTGLQDTVRMVVDDINNKLIIQATAADYAYISDTIKKMDVMPRQALIDAKVFEVDLSNNLDFGVTSALEGVTTAAADHSTGASIDTTGNFVANTFSFVGNAREILMKLKALRSKTKVKVLESPSVLALDGTIASINVGAEIPYPAGGYVTTGGSSTSINYRKTGITLMVMPRISASGSVTLNITQEVSAQGGDVTVGSGQTATSFNVTTVTTTFTVKDGETVAIAGLIRESKDFGRSGVPFLSEIPILGSLFGSSSKHITRNELIILITPHVIRTVERLEEMTQELKDSLRHVRSLADEHEQERIQDMEDARKERYGQDQKEIKRIKPAKQEKVKKSDKSGKSEKVEEPKEPDKPQKVEETKKPEEPAKPSEPKKPELPPQPEEPKKPN